MSHCAIRFNAGSSHRFAWLRVLPALVLVFSQAHAQPGADGSGSQAEPASVPAEGSVGVTSDEAPSPPKKAARKGRSRPASAPHPLKDRVKVDVAPSFKHDMTTMFVGKRMHLDRKYTFDVVPPVLIGGLLFRGIHRPPKGTVVNITLKQPTRVYFFFHPTADGGYAEIFKRLPGWRRKETAPQYDIRNGLHGRRMIMYLAHLPAGTHQIPATTESRGCFSIVFQDAVPRSKRSPTASPVE